MSRYLDECPDGGETPKDLKDAGIDTPRESFLRQQAFAMEISELKEALSQKDQENTELKNIVKTLESKIDMLQERCVIFAKNNKNIESHISHM